MTRQLRTPGDPVPIAVPTPDELKALDDAEEAAGRIENAQPLILVAPQQAERPVILPAAGPDQSLPDEADIDAHTIERQVLTKTGWVIPAPKPDTRLLVR